MGYIAFVLDEPSRERLLEAYPPVYERVIAHHVTLKFGVTQEALESVKAEFEGFEFIAVLGHAVDAATNCVAVITDTGYGAQENGTPLHVTISVAQGQSPVKAGQTAKLVTGPCRHMVLTGSIQYCQ